VERAAGGDTWQKQPLPHMESGIRRNLIRGSAPPLSETFFSFPAAKNPTDCPSGEKKGLAAPSLPRIARGLETVYGACAKLVDASMVCDAHQTRAIRRYGYNRSRSELERQPVSRWKRHHQARDWPCWGRWSAQQTREGATNAEAREDH
jgi:hypothetical protein